jgi:multidrug efflux pump subunit AcrB
MMVFATSPLGLIGVVPTLLMFNQPFGINALVGLIALSGILMRNTLILIGQIEQNAREGMTPFDSVVEAIIQRSRSVILTAARCNAGFHPADAFDVLGNPGLYADRRHVCGNDSDAAKSDSALEPSASAII